MNVNSQYFTEEQIKAGQMQKLLDFLMSEAYDSGDYYNDIHIYPSDCHSFTVEWVQIHWSRDFGGHFEYVDEEQVVMLEKVFPDGHYEQCYDEDDYKERLDEWLKENPDWKTNAFGTWYNVKEQEEWEKLFKKEDNDLPKDDVHLENGVIQ